MGSYHRWPAEARPAPLAEQAKAACSHPSPLARKLALSIFIEDFRHDPEWSWLSTYATDIAAGHLDMADEFIAECAAWDAERDEWEREHTSASPFGSYVDGRYSLERDARDGGWL